jgi:hypothetical protein
VFSYRKLTFLQELVMAVSSNNPTSISDIEQQIAAVTFQLEQARLQQLVAAEKAYLAAQKAAEVAQNKVQDLSAKPSTTVAAQNRLLTATAAAEEQEIKLVAAFEVFDALKTQQKASEKFARKVGRVLAGKKIGKKIKFTHAEKAVIKEDKKAAKKIAKAEKKTQKKIDKENTLKEIFENVAPEVKEIVQKRLVKKEAAKKAPVKKAPVKKAPAKKVALKTVESVSEVTPEKSEVEPEVQSTNLEQVENVQSVEVPLAPEVFSDAPVETIPATESISEPRDTGTESLDKNADA